jgi:hypothetical protein
MSQGRLQRSYLIEAADQFIALRVIGAVGDVFLGILDVAGERIKIEIFPRDGAIREHRQSSRTHLGEAANNDDCLAPAFANDRHHAGPQRRYHWGMTGQDAQIALDPRQIDLIDVAGEEHVLRRYEFEV